ncbi:MAG: SDR family oxidoreductase [Sandaracinaceae bacterium]|nr:SDR family oxidoreductase [Sandaracinaceae bacterium]
MMEVVAQKTGYPAEMLTPSMELEADLGVDSIKRVEILAGLRERAPELPELDPAELGKLRTLEEIASLLGSAAAPLVAPPSAAPALRDLRALMMEVVAQKTGYPVEMLAPSMELEADLGVDSIKRVEILAALRERAPELPELDPAELGKLRTLEEIAALLGSAAPPLVASPSAAPAVRDLRALMMEVVAQKTGYPVEMLAPSMELEADLGVDSIKRVEILAALRERAPELPELDPAELGKLRTLEEIARLLGQGAGQSVASARPENGKRPPPARVSAGAPARPLERAVVGLAPAEAPGLAPPGLFGARLVAVTDDGRGVADRLVALLREEGVAAEKVARAQDDADAVIVLAGLAPIERAREACREAFDAARAVAARFTEAGGLFVTVQDAGGGLGILPSERAELAALTGLAKTAALEWPRATVRALDVESSDPARAAARIARELIEGGAAPEVGIDADGVRRVPRLAASALPAPSEASAPVVLASGGARGVTAACLVALARRAGGRYLLLGRSAVATEPAHARGKSGAELKRALLEEARARGEAPSPRELDAALRRIEAGREVQRTLEALREAGAEARYVALDVRDGAALAGALREARDAFGPFTTLVHGAGVLADRRIADKKDEDFERVFATKVDGLRALLDATRSDPLESIVLFSSVAARFGNAGQSDYSMANAVLDAVAAREAAARPGARVRAIAWGPWEGGMVTPELAAHFASRGVSLIDLEGGAGAFVGEALSDGPSSVVIGAELAAPVTEHRVEIRVSRGTHPYLVDHAVAGAPVVPVVLVVDWIARAARGLKPELVVARVRDVAVLRGITLSRFDQGERFTIVLRLVSNGHGATYAAELRDARGACYRAEVDLLPELPAGAPVRPAPADLEARSAPLYGGCLFHGERFRVIRRLDGVGEAGAAGLLEGTLHRGWEGSGWQTDPALLDGGLQLAVLWSERRLGGAALPTGLDAVCLHREGPIEGPVRAFAYGRSAASSRAVCDVLFVDQDGRPVAELRGVETHVRPGTAADARAR